MAEINLKTMTETELQALGYRALVNIEQHQLLLRTINEELQLRRAAANGIAQEEVKAE